MSLGVPQTWYQCALQDSSLGCKSHDMRHGPPQKFLHTQFSTFQVALGSKLLGLYELNQKKNTNVCDMEIVDQCKQIKSWILWQVTQIGMHHSFLKQPLVSSPRKKIESWVVCYTWIWQHIIGGEATKRWATGLCPKEPQCPKKPQKTVCIGQGSSSNFCILFSQRVWAQKVNFTRAVNFHFHDNCMWWVKSPFSEPEIRSLMGSQWTNLQLDHITMQTCLPAVG